MKPLHAFYSFWFYWKIAAINHKCLTIFSHVRYEPKKTVQFLRKRWPLNVDCVAHQCRLLCCTADADGVWYRVCRHHLQCTGYKTKRVVSKVDQRGLFLLYSYIIEKICATLYIPRSWPLLSSCQPQSTQIRLHTAYEFMSLFQRLRVLQCYINEYDALHAADFCEKRECGPRLHWMIEHRIALIHLRSISSGGFGCTISLFKQNACKQLQDRPFVGSQRSFKFSSK